MKTFRALAVGDVVGRCGREALERGLAELQWQQDVDFTVVNGENICNGKGINRRSFAFLRELGVDAVTLGNHIWGNREIDLLLGQEERLVRPANLPKVTAGRGWQLVPLGKSGLRVAVLNLLGRVYMNMPALDCPFAAAEAALAELRELTPIVLVDFHAETTSEKLALANFLDGRVTALWGTHTHIQTNDARLLPRGTAYISDIGMTGALDSILGVECQGVIQRYLTGRPMPFAVADSGPALLCGAVIEFGEDGRALGIRPVQKELF